MVQCGREEADLSTEEEFGDVLKDSDVLNKEYEIYSEAVKKKIALVDEICESDSALYSAVKEGCVMSVEGEELIYRTPLKPIHTIVNASFEAYHIPAVVKLDCAIEL